MAKHLAIILSSIILSGCMTRYITPELPIPLVCDEWTYPAISSVELACITPDTYDKLVVRDTEKTAQIAELCAIIQAHNDRLEKP
mgnify:CR=1 FL=1